VSRWYGTLTTTVCGRPRSTVPQALRRLVVEHAFPPAARHVFRDDDERDRLGLVRWPGLVEDVEVGEQWARQRPIRRLDDDQRDARNLALERGSYLHRLRRIVRDVDRPDVVTDRAADVDGMDRCAVEPGIGTITRLAHRRLDDEIGSMASSIEERVLAPDEQHHGHEQRTRMTTRWRHRRTSLTTTSRTTAVRPRPSR
jgi:hypothetical protein